MFCEKCGNKLEEGFAFCDKCGAKVEKKTTKKKEHDEKHEHEEKKSKVKEEKIVEEKVEEKVEKPIPPRKTKNGGKGKTVFLVIFNLLLVAATVTFLILWLTKSTDCNCDYSKKDKDPDVVDPKKEKNEYVGKWEQNVEYKKGSKVTKRTYGLIELKENGSFEALFYDKDNISKTKEETKGKYTIKGNKITFSYKDDDGDDDTLEVIVKNNKMCLNDDCEDYLVKEGNNKIVIYDDDDDDIVEIKTIKYAEYEKLQKEYKDAIVVVVREGCSWCEKYESVVEEISEEYSTPVYYYESDGKISISGTPTTIIIKNGYIVGTIEGYKEFDAVSDILDEYGVK